MLGVSGLMGSSGDGAADGGASGGSSEAGAASSSVPGGGMEEIGGGNRWPRQETLALLKIRSDMGVTFRDSCLKGPLWEEVSRKMAELGYQRSAKKCKEKFENVYKYHKRTKDGRASKSDGKTYRFFDQLEALENTPPPPPTRAPSPMPANPNPRCLPIQQPPHFTVTSTRSPNPVSIAPPAQVSNSPIDLSSPSFQHSQQPFQPPRPPVEVAAATNTSIPIPPPPHHQIHHTSQPHFPVNFLADSTSTSSTSSDEDIQRRRGRKRKWKDFFERLMKDVIHKQEDLQRKFLDALEKRERDRMAREEAWRVQEMERMNREHDILVQERSIAAAKDAAVIAFLQKVTEQHNFQIPIGTNINDAQPQPPQPPQQVPMQAPPPENPQPPAAPPPPPPPLVQSLTLPPPPPKPVAAPTVPMVATPIKISPDTSKTDTDCGGAGDNSISANSSRWPKAEVEALINLRRNLDLKYQDNGPKGPLWEEISAAMGKIGYSRSSKRCKEKWENINKYFKKVKESNKKRPEDSKTCPYFHQLDALYKEKAKNDAASFNPNPGIYAMNQDNPMAAIMARPEQQWPIPADQQQQQDPQDSVMPDQQDHDDESDNIDRDEDDDDEEEEDEGGGFEIVANRQVD